MRLTKYGETVLPELNGVHDLSQTARTNILPLKYGSIDLDGTETVLNHKQISASAVINTDFDDTMDDLAYEAQKGARILEATMRDDSKRQLLAKMSVFSRGAKADKYTCEQEYGFQWLAMYPYWLHSDDEPYYTNHGYTTQSGISTGDARHDSISVSSASVSFSIDNTSRVRIPKVNFTLKELGTSGQWNNPKITNLTTGHYIQINRGITANSTYTRQAIYVDCLNKKVFCAYTDNANNVAEYNLYPYVETSPDFIDWMILEPGVNNFTITGTLVGGSITRDLLVYWSRHYV